MDLGLKDAVVVVQGGTQGMGGAAADCFAAEGARVGVIARTRSALDATVDRLLELGAAEAFALQADIGNREQVDAAFAEVKSRYGVLNVLVNTAGPGGVGMIDELDDDIWAEAVNVGAMGMVRCVRAALPLLRAAEWARVVNISAHSVRRQIPGLVAYTAAKAMTTSVTKNLSQHLAKDNIMVNCVSPGTFMSPSLQDYVRSMGWNADDPVEVMRQVSDEHHTPAYLGRAGWPAEIGAVICFAGSRRNTYMTGADINVDGGSDF